MKYRDCPKEKVTISLPEPLARALRIRAAECGPKVTEAEVVALLVARTFGLPVEWTTSPGLESGVRTTGARVPLASAR